MTRVTNQRRKTLTGPICLRNAAAAKTCIKLTQDTYLILDTSANERSHIPNQKEWATNQGGDGESRNSLLKKSSTSATRRERSAVNSQLPLSVLYT